MSRKDGIKWSEDSINYMNMRIVSTFIYVENKMQFYLVIASLLRNHVENAQCEGRVSFATVFDGTRRFYSYGAYLLIFRLNLIFMLELYSF